MRYIKNSYHATLRIKNGTLVVLARINVSHAQWKGTCDCRFYYPARRQSNIKNQSYGYINAQIRLDLDLRVQSLPFFSSTIRRPFLAHPNRTFLTIQHLLPFLDHRVHRRPMLRIDNPAMSPSYLESDEKKVQWSEGY